MTASQIYKYKSFYRQLLWASEGDTEKSLLVLEALWKFDQEV